MLYKNPLENLNHVPELPIQRCSSNLISLLVLYYVVLVLSAAEQITSIGCFIAVIIKPSVEMDVFIKIDQICSIGVSSRVFLTIYYEI